MMMKSEFLECDTLVFLRKEDRCQNMYVAALQKPPGDHARTQNDSSNAQRYKRCGEMWRFQSDAFPIFSFTIR